MDKDKLDQDDDGKFVGNSRLIRENCLTTQQNDARRYGQDSNDMSHEYNRLGLEESKFL